MILINYGFMNISQQRNLNTHRVYVNPRWLRAQKAAKRVVIPRGLDEEEKEQEEHASPIWMDSFLRDPPQPLPLEESPDLELDLHKRSC